MLPKERELALQWGELDRTSLCFVPPTDYKAIKATNALGEEINLRQIDDSPWEAISFRKASDLPITIHCVGNSDTRSEVAITVDTEDLNYIRENHLRH